MKSSANRWTAAAPSSRMRRRTASITPAITRNDDHTSPWNRKNAITESCGNRKAGNPNATAS